MNGRGRTSVGRGVVALAVALGCAAGAAEGRTLHVDPAGNDRHAGSPERPLASLDEALRRLKAEPGPAEVVLHEGVYPPVQIHPRGKAGDRPRPRLVVRAARRPDGAFEEVRFEAGAAVRGAEPVAGAPGVYRLAVRWKEREEPQMWERERRTRYALVADAQAVAHFPASFTVRDDHFLLHTSDGRPPEELGVGLSRERSGILVWRSDVTLRGLQVRDAVAAGIIVRGRRVIVEDCRVENSRRGVSVAGDDSRVRGLRADDVGGGVYVNAADVLVEDSRLFKRRDGFAWLTHAQDDSGVQFYYPAKRGLARRNLAVGFDSCAFVKSSGGGRIERNTCVHPGRGAFGVGGGWESPDTAVRDNLVVGYTWPVMLYESVRAGTVVDGNCFWHNRDENTVKRTFAHLARVGTGASNVSADPRFADPDAGDYRPLAGGCAGRGPEPPGALAGAGAEADRRAPELAVTLAEPARPVRVELPVHAERAARLGGAPTELAAEQLPAVSEWITPDSEVRLRIPAGDAGGRPRRLRVQGCDGQEIEKPFRATHVVSLVPGRSQCTIRVRVANAAGRWSEPAVMRVHHGGPPRIRSGPHVHASRHGAVLVLETGQPVTVRVETEPALAATSHATVWLPDADAINAESLAARRIVHRVVLAAPERAGRYRYRLSLRDTLGRETTTPWSSLSLEGPARTRFVSPTGRDAEAAGDAATPWRTLQFAVDRALPGDRIVLAPGLYAGQTVLTQGGLEGAPITVESSVRGAAVLDGGKRVAHCLELREAPFVTFDGLEIRWADDTMIRAVKSPGLTVRHARIWGDLWFGRADVGSLKLTESPGATVDRAVIFQCRGLMLRDSPRFILTNSTLFANSFSTVSFLRSVRGSVCRNNSLAFNGNEIFSFARNSPSDFQTFESDYNNLGSHLLEPPKGSLARRPGLKERLPGRRNLEPVYGRFTGATKRLVYLDGGATVFHTLEGWRAWSGQDRHSVFADPRYVDVGARDFRLRPDSPNRAAGPDGATIGALGVAGPARGVGAAGRAGAD